MPKEFDRKKAFTIMDAYAASKSLFMRAYYGENEEKLEECLNNAKEHYLDELEELFGRCNNG